MLKIHAACKPQLSPNLAKQTKVNTSMRMWYKI